MFVKIVMFDTDLSVLFPLFPVLRPAGTPFPPPSALLLQVRPLLHTVNTYTPLHISVSPLTTVVMNLIFLLRLLQIKI